MADNPELHILLIEDSRTQVFIVREGLRAELGIPFVLETDDCLAEGLKRLAHTQFDLLLLDLHVPDSSGFDTFLAAKASTDVPIVIVSGEVDDASARRAVDDGARGYLVKGEYTPETLAECVREAVNRTK